MALESMLQRLHHVRKDFVFLHVFHFEIRILDTKPFSFVRIFFSNNGVFEIDNIRALFQITFFRKLETSSTYRICHLLYLCFEKEANVGFESIRTGFFQFARSFDVGHNPANRRRFNSNKIEIFVITRCHNLRSGLSDDFDPTRTWRIFKRVLQDSKIFKLT